MNYKGRRAGVVIILGLCCLPVCALLALGNLLFGFWIPAPSNATIEHAIRFAPGTGGPGNDGRMYDITAIDRPSRHAAADPKMWIWLRVHNMDGTVHQEGLLNLALIGGNSRHMVVGPFIPRTEITRKLLNDNFTEQERAHIYTLISP